MESATEAAESLAHDACYRGALILIEGAYLALTEQDQVFAYFDSNPVMTACTMFVKSGRIAIELVSDEADAIQTARAELVAILPPGAAFAVESTIRKTIESGQD